MNALLIGRPGTFGGFVARSLILPSVVCAALVSVVGGAQLLGAHLPDGTVQVGTISP